MFCFPRNEVNYSPFDLKEAVIFFLNKKLFFPSKILRDWPSHHRAGRAGLLVGGLLGAKAEGVSAIHAYSHTQRPKAFGLCTGGRR